MADAKTVQCKGCGFLALVNRETRLHDQTDENFREHGDVPTESVRDDMMAGLPVPVLLHFDGPRCFALKFPLHEEYQEQIDLSQRPNDAVLHVITEDRTCGSFIKWVHGFTPKEHKTMQREAERDAQNRWHQWLTLSVAVLGPIAAAITGGLFRPQTIVVQPPSVTVQPPSVTIVQPTPTPAQPPAPAKTPDQPPTRTSPK